MKFEMCTNLHVEVGYKKSRYDVTESTVHTNRSRIDQECEQSTTVYVSCGYKTEKVF